MDPEIKMSTEMSKAVWEYSRVISELQALLQQSSGISAKYLGSDDKTVGCTSLAIIQKNHK